MEESNPQDQPERVSRGAGVRMAFIRDLLGRAGELGMTTDDIFGMFLAAGQTARRQTILEDLAAMQSVGLVEERDERWFGVPDPSGTPNTVPAGWENAHGDEDRADQGGMVLAIPFVACTSEGGPYDDEAFVSGVLVGEVMTTLRTLKALDAAETGRFWVGKGLRKQLDLVAMHYGFVMEVEEVEGPEFEEMCWVSFTKSDPV